MKNTQERRNQVLVMLYQNMGRTEANDTIGLIDKLCEESVLEMADIFDASDCDLSKFREHRKYAKGCINSQ